MLSDFKNDMMKYATDLVDARLANARFVNIGRAAYGITFSSLDNGSNGQQGFNGSLNKHSDMNGSLGCNLLPQAPQQQQQPQRPFEPQTEQPPLHPYPVSKPEPVFIDPVHHPRTNPNSDIKVVNETVRHQATSFLQFQLGITEESGCYEANCPWQCHRRRSVDDAATRSTPSSSFNNINDVLERISLSECFYLHLKANFLLFCCDGNPSLSQNVTFFSVWPFALPLTYIRTEIRSTKHEITVSNSIR
eukprot:GILJ01026291.1.p1 GENE.GILJ01026291.1~~GILJ01026291.1.p1  ORF type:complete len:248 (+),score=21.50 GILJ01026291.1:297-1040(+)